jgi:hypothetical protein
MIQSISEKKVFSGEKKRKPKIPSFSSCLNQIWNILFQNSLFKKEEISCSEENFHLCII